MSLAVTLDDLPAPARSRRHGSRISERLAWLFAAPSIVLLLLTMIAPIAAVVMTSFTDYELGALDLSFVGLANYRALAGDPAFWRSLGNTLWYVAMVVPGSVLIGLGLAVLVNGLKHGRGFYQVAFFLPVTSTLIAMATVWKYLLHGTIGPVNHLLVALGFDKVEFFGNSSLTLASLAVVAIWQLAGFNMVLFLAGLTAIPEDLYEAAAVDGIDRAWERFFKVTLPLLGPTTVFVVVTTTITAFKVFDTVAVLTHGGPQGSTNVLLYSIYLEGFQDMHIGLASAMTVVFLAVILGLALIQAKILDRRNRG